ncbi:hypothetical protein PHJA_000579300 [Phtheirospermum japonicum]|uniref:Uncharacterized protein n=1 Tax=Phtheirospermum japonicum TaxID=374723 RepID=A0A830BBE0_9LAMI|nr:hypothetical protein PHJA_000579300 [Phtheirospermum japonicum]
MFSRSARSNHPPGSDQNDRDTLKLVKIVDEAQGRVNPTTVTNPVPYRKAPSNVRQTVHRWATQAPPEIFRNGFQLRARDDLDEDSYYDLCVHVLSGTLLVGTACRMLTCRRHGVEIRGPLWTRGRGGGPCTSITSGWD